MSRAEFLNTISHKYTSSELKLVQTSYWLSKNVHRPQQRKNGERYFEHPLRVAKCLIGLGYFSPDLVATAFLHDVVEDTYAPPHVIVDLFGVDIWYNVSTLSKTRPMLDPVTLEMISVAKIEQDKYFEQIMKANKAVRLVKVADRVDNTTDLPTFTPERKAKYIKETLDYIVPIARETDPDLLRMLRNNLAKCDVIIP